MSKLPSLFSNRPISMKLATMTVVQAICMALVAATVLLVARNQLISERTDKAQAMVDAAWNMADNFQKQAAAGKMTEDEAQARFFAAASAIWHEDHTNYPFMYDYETGIAVVNPGAPTLLNKEMRWFKPPPGLRFAAMMMDIAPKGGAGEPI